MFVFNAVFGQSSLPSEWVIKAMFRVIPEFHGPIDAVSNDQREEEEDLANET